MCILQIFQLNTRCQDNKPKGTKSDKEEAPEDEEEEDDIQSENEACGGRIAKERKLLGGEDIVVTLECMNVTSLEQNKAALI